MRREEGEKKREKTKREREREREKRNKEISWSSLLLRRREGGKRRRGLCRGCLVGSSEAPTRCPTAFVWYFINTSANYFPFFTVQFVAESGNAPYKPTRSSLLSRFSICFSCSWPPKIRAYKPANVRTDTHARTRVSAYTRLYLAARKRKKKVRSEVREK